MKFIIPALIFAISPIITQAAQYCVVGISSTQCIYNYQSECLKAAREIDGTCILNLKEQVPTQQRERTSIYIPKEAPIPDYIGLKKMPEQQRAATEMTQPFLDAARAIKQQELENQRNESERKQNELEIEKSKIELEILKQQLESSKKRNNSPEQIENIKTYNISVITVKSIWKAESVKKMLSDGHSFYELAKKYSIGPNSSNGGNIGDINPKDYKENIQKAILNLKHNEISDIITMDDGWSIILRND